MSCFPTGHISTASIPFTVSLSSSLKPKQIVFILRLVAFLQQCGFAFHFFTQEDQISCLIFHRLLETSIQNHIVTGVKFMVYFETEVNSNVQLWQ